jgi:hypothetical protein
VGLKLYQIFSGTGGSLNICSKHVLCLLMLWLCKDLCCEYWGSNKVEMKRFASHSEEDIIAKRQNLVPTNTVKANKAALLNLRIFYLFFSSRFSSCCVLPVYFIFYSRKEYLFCSYNRFEFKNGI